MTTRDITMTTRDSHHSRADNVPGVLQTSHYDAHRPVREGGVGGGLQVAALSLLLQRHRLCARVAEEVCLLLEREHVMHNENM
jgi:hypothetical protein